MTQSNQEQMHKLNHHKEESKTFSTNHFNQSQRKDKEESTKPFINIGFTQWLIGEVLT